MKDKDIDIQFGLLKKFMSIVIDKGMMDLEWDSLKNSMLTHGHWVSIRYKDKIGFYTYDQTKSIRGLKSDNIEWIKIKPYINSSSIEIDITLDELKWFKKSRIKSKLK